ncbi:MAG: hypothetical protein R2695_12510 [Acidimicrobiales bacterium]
MTDPACPYEPLLDLFVYAPIGFALEAKDLIPKLIDRGRGQVALARLAGKVATDRGQAEARRTVDQVVGIVGTVLAGRPAILRRPMRSPPRPRHRSRSTTTTPSRHRSCSRCSRHSARWNSRSSSATNRLIAAASL